MKAWHSPDRQTVAHDDGQASSEYVGVLAVVALVIALVLAANPGGVIRDGTQASVEQVLSGTATERNVPAGTAAQAPPDLVVMRSASSGGSNSGGTWRRVARDVCVVLVLICGNQTDTNPRNNLKVPKAPMVQQKEVRDKREAETAPRQPAAEPSSGDTLTPQPLTTYQPQQAPPIGGRPDEDDGVLAWLGEAANVVGTAVVVVVGGILTVLGWFLPQPGTA